MKNLIGLILICGLTCCESSVKTNASSEISKTKKANIYKKEETMKIDDSLKELDDSLDIKFLRGFYMEYIHITADIVGNEYVYRIDSLKKISCDGSLIDKIENLDIDYDPFLKAQDANNEMINSLHVCRTPKKGAYQVSYLDGYSNKRTTIDVKIKFINKEPMICDIEI